MKLVERRLVDAFAGLGLWVDFMTAQRSLLLALVVVLSGCASLEPFVAHVNTVGEVGECARYLKSLDARIDKAGVRDAGAARIAGFPYLRVDRPLAALRPSSSRATAFDAWMSKLRALDASARAVEVANLPPAQAETLEPPGGLSLRDAAMRCSERLLATDRRDANARAMLWRQAHVPDDYRWLKRAIGLYPLTALGFKAGVDELHDELAADFGRPLSELPVNGRLVRYGLAAGDGALSKQQVAGIVARSAQNALGLPEPTPAERARLFETFAPIFEVDVAAGSDRLGSPVWRKAAVAQIDVATPRVYTKTSFTKFEGTLLLQLAYTVWFPARPRASTWDLLGGHLDGLVWRVTLGPDGVPLVYDTIHNCGCYHMFIPNEQLQLRESEALYDEPVFIAQRVVPRIARPVLRIASRTHYLQRMYWDEGAKHTIGYQLSPYASLRSMPTPAGTRKSLFTSKGFVAGTERGERWLFWPMGIDNPGAMRQWGRHPVAFVGRRHFDDIDLLTRLFSRAGPSPPAFAGAGSRGQALTPALPGNRL